MNVQFSALTAPSPPIESKPDHSASGNNAPAYMETNIIKIVQTTIDKKLQTLSSIIKHEIDSSPSIQRLQSATTMQLSQALLNLQKQSKPQPKATGFHQLESKDFHVIKLLKLLVTHTLGP